MNICQSFEKYQNDDTFRKFCCKKLKLVQGDKEITLDLYIPTLVLFDIDPDYFKVCISSKFSDTEVSYGIDEQLESFEGFEAFIRDYMTCKFPINLDLNSDIDHKKYQTSLRFNKHIYCFEYSNGLTTKVSSMIDKTIIIKPNIFTKGGHDFTYSLKVSYIEDGGYTVYAHKHTCGWTNGRLFIGGCENKNFIGIPSGGRSFTFDKKYTDFSISESGCIIEIN